MKNKYLPYKLIGDVVYTMRPWFFTPFKGVKDGVSSKMNHKNYIQSSTRMAVKRAFGCLKGRWRIFLKRIDVPLQNLPNLVAACICLHNLCISHSDGFNMRWTTEAKKDIRDSTNLHFGNLMQTTLNATKIKIAKKSIKQMKLILLPLSKALLSGLFHYEGKDPETLTNAEDGESSESKKDKNDRIKKLLEQTTVQYDHMTLNSWRLHLARENTITFDEALDIEYT